MGDQSMLVLSESFPTLKGALDGWDPAALHEWACGAAATDSGRHAARFVLSVWNEAAPWRCGSFSVSRAMGIWDAEHRAAFVEWAKAPWWP